MSPHEPVKPPRRWMPPATRPWLGATGILIVAIASGLCSRAEEPTRFSVSLRNQIPWSAGSDRYMPVEEAQQWPADRVAVIVCDVWDAHHCLNAVRRVTELAPNIDALTHHMRERGATIIHAPSDCTGAYDEHPSRARAKAAFSNTAAPDSIRSWCNSLESEAGLPYPVDQSDGGEDDDSAEHAQWHAMLESLGRDAKRPWLRQSPAIRIDADRDYISESGTEIWHILKQKHIEHVLVCGVHTNMCVLGRPFGLRQLKAHGFQPILVRDLTDAMYNPQRWPYVNHFTGTELVIDHIERSVCQTISSDQILGDKPFRFSSDHRPRWVIMISEDEYRTERTLTEWARIHLARDCELHWVFEHPTNPGHFPGIESLEHADGLLVSVRRRPLASDTMRSVRSYIARGRPVLGIRTSSHAFSLRENAPSPSLEQWPEFDAQVFGGNYNGHHPDGPVSRIELVDGNASPWIQSQRPRDARPGDELFGSRGSLYRVTPLQSSARVVWQGTIPEQPSQPVAWTFVRADSGKSFYTSLGHESDFEQPLFRAMLLQAAHWLTGSPSVVTEDEVEAQRRDYHRGQGKQK